MLNRFLVFFALVVLLSLVSRSAGQLANTVACKANGDKMPVVARAEYRQEVAMMIYGSETHCLANENTKYLWLADRYYKIVHGHVRSIYSIGDVFIRSGNWVFSVTMPMLSLLLFISLFRNNCKKKGAK